MMDMVKTLEAVRGKVLDAAHFDLLKHAYERAVSNMKELSDMIQRSNSEAMDLLNRRFAEAMDEVKSLVQQSQSQTTR